MAQVIFLQTIEKHMEGENSMKYEEPTMCCVIFDEEDIIATSPGLDNEGEGFGDVLNPDDLVP